MSAPKPIGKESLNKVMKLLYLSTAADVQSQTQRLANEIRRSHLQDRLESIGEPTSNFTLQKIPSVTTHGLLEATHKLKSITAAPQHIPYTVGQPQSHILHFRSKNSLLTKVDFINLLPSVEQSIYNTAELPNQRLEFEVVKARKPETLLFDNGYYLIFPSYEQACVFWSETFGKQLSGKEFRLVFASLSEHYQCIHSETLGEVSPVLQSYLPELPAYFSHSEWETGYHPQAPRLVVKRTQCALVRNLPFHVTADSIRNTLWDYDFYNTPRSLQSLLKGEKLTMEPTQHIFQHRKSNSNIWLLRFANHSNATRFVRSFNGTQWYANNNIALNNFFKLSGKRVSETGESVTEEYATEHDEGKYTEPLLCEILD